MLLRAPLVNIFRIESAIKHMKLMRMIVGEIILLGASILIFRSVWILLDQYFGYSNLWPMLVIGMLLTISGLMIINHEVELEMKGAKKSS